MALLLLLGGAARAVEMRDVPAADYIRLHVVAEDDGDAAQALKLRVRDAVLEKARALLADCQDADAAWRIVSDNAEALRLAAQERARQAGFDGPVSAETGVFGFPDRDYGGVIVPAGEYRALRVVIGAGAGHNWWCVLYPTLCLQGDAAPGEPVVFHSVIWDWLCRLFGGGA